MESPVGMTLDIHLPSIAVVVTYPKIAPFHLANEGAPSKLGMVHVSIRAGYARRVSGHQIRLSVTVKSVVVTVDAESVTVHRKMPLTVPAGGRPERKNCGVEVVAVPLLIGMFVPLT